MIRICTLIWLLALPLSLNCQERIISIPKSRNTLIYTRSLPEATTLDSTKISVAYHLSFIRDAESKHQWEDMVVLQVGNNYTKYFSLWAFQLDSAATTRTKYNLWNWMSEQEAREQFEKIRPKHPVTPSQVWFQTSIKDAKFYASEHTEIIINDSISTTYQPEPFSEERGYCYTEKITHLNWIINNDSIKLIKGYKCNKAYTHYRGRDYICWFTPEIPVNLGPYKFHGLPGLILEIEDSKKNYMWKCISISTVFRPIYSYKYHFKLISRTQFYKWQERIHSDPASIFDKTDTYILIYDPQNGTEMPKEYHWSIPYNPIELE